MILIVATLVGVLSASLGGGDLRRIAALPLRHLWVVWVAILAQIVVFGLLVQVLPEGLTNALHLVTYGFALSFLWLNRHLPGAAAIGVGAACNLAAISANGGVMPASPGAWQRAGFDKIPELQAANSHVLDDPKLAFLGDVFAVPEAWPLSNVFSLGDIVIALAATYLAHRWCRSPRTSNAWPAPVAADIVAAPVTAIPA
ncbi:MAG: DUF5317 domain-containing protein [Ilumatobacter sp.]|nr:DUF5317 domain-containing protein [Ilumatobacter sp.]